MSKLNQFNDIEGSQNHNSAMTLANEPLLLGTLIAGQAGVAASLNGIAPNITVSGLTGMTANSICKTLTISGANNIANNGIFNIIQYINPTSVVIFNSSFIGPETNNGNLTWAEYNQYSAEDDNNYHRTDRANIKGVPYYSSIPQYTTCSDQNTPIDANLSNIAGHTTDAKALIDNIKYTDLTVNSGDTYLTLTSAGNLKHADIVNITGVPVSGNDYATFVSILRDGYSTKLNVLSGEHAGWIVYGKTREGASISPNSVEIEFMMMPQNGDFSQALPYTWEVSQYTNIEVIIGYRISLENLSEVALRKILVDLNYVNTSINIPTLQQVLIASNDANFLDIINVNNLLNNNIYSDDGYISNNLTVGNSITAVDGYFTHLHLPDNFLTISDLDGYIKLDSVTVENLTTVENNTGKLLAPDGTGGVTWIIPPSLDGYATINDLDLYAKITDLDGYIKGDALDGYIKVDAVTTDNLSTTENDTGKLLAPDGTGGVTWITPPSLDGYLTIDDLDPYAKITDLDGYLTIADLDGYITGSALDGYIKVDAVNTDNLSTTENDTGKLLAPDGAGGVTWITPPSLDGYLTISDLDPYAKITDLDGYLTIVDLDGYIKVDAVNTDNLSTTENDTGKLLAPDGAGGVIWIVPPSLDGYLTASDLDPYAKITDLDGYLTMADLDGYLTGSALDGYIKVDAVTTDNLSTTENDTGKLLAPDGTGGVTWITPPSLDGYLTMADLDGYLTGFALDGYIKLDAVNTDNLSTTENDTGKLLAPDGAGGVTWITPPSLDGYLTITDLDGYIKVDAVTINNLSTSEYNEFLVLRPNGIGGVKWSNDGYLITPDTVTDNAVVRWDGIDGYSVKNSNVLIDDSDNVSGIVKLSSSYFSTTANDATFDFASGTNNVIIGDGYVKASGSSLQTYIGNTSELTLSNSSLYPSTNNGLDLGSSSNYWEDGYITNIRAMDGYFNNTLTINGVNVANIYSIVKDPSGFPNRTDSTLNVNDDGYIFSIAPVSGSFDFYIKGVKYTKTTTQSVSFTNVEGIHFFYFNSAGVLTHTLSEDDWVNMLLGDGAIVGAIYWDLTNTQTIYLAEERHGFMNPQTHAYLHLAFGAQWISGGQLTNIISGATGALDSHAQFGLTTTSMADEDNFFTYTDGVPQEFDPIAYIPIFYQLGAPQIWRVKTPDTFPFIQSGSAGYTGVDGLPAYNYYNAGVWSLAQVPNGNYFLMHYYVGNDINRPVFGVLGQTQYINLGAAQTGAETEINNLGVILRSLSKEFTPLGTVIYQVSKTYGNTVKCRIVKTAEGLDYIDFRGNVLSGSGSSSGGITDHGNLTGLADDDHTQYLLIDGSRAMTGPLSGVTTFGSSYLTTTANDATFNFGSNDVIIGDGYIKASVSTLQTYIGNTSRLTLSGDNLSLYPSTNLGLNLGSLSRYWGSAYITTLTLNGAVSGVTTIESSYLTTTAREATFNFGSNDVVIGDGYIKASGSSLQTYVGTTSELTLTNTALYPTTDLGLSLGTADYRWNDVYSDYVNITDAANATLQITAGNASVSIINFGDTDQADVGRFFYNHADNSFGWYLDNNSELKLSSTTLYPTTNLGLSLGSASYRFSKIYGAGIDLYNDTGCALTLKSNTASNAYINFGDDDSGSQGRLLYSNSTDTFSFRINNIDELILSPTSIYPNTSQGLDLGSTSKWFKDGYFVYGRFAASVLPDVDLGADLGASDLRWSSLYVSKIYSDYVNITNAANATLQIKAGTASSATINFGDVDDTDIGKIYYNNTNENLCFRVDTVDRVFLTPSAVLFNFGTNDVVIGDGYIKASGSTLQTYIGTTSKLTLSASTFSPSAHDGLTCGDATNHWSVVYASSGSINTSDERKKQDILPIDGYVLDAWEDISLVFFRYIDAVNEKGDDARIHSGFISQKIRDAFTDHGLNAHKYGLFCYDSWEAELDSEGNIIKPAGDNYGIRISECLAVEAAYQRRRADRIEEQNKLLSARIDRIEQLLNIQE